MIFERLLNNIFLLFIFVLIFNFSQQLISLYFYICILAFCLLFYSFASVGIFILE